MLTHSKSRIRHSTPAASHSVAVHHLTSAAASHLFMPAQRHPHLTQRHVSCQPTWSLRLAAPLSSSCPTAPHDINLPSHLMCHGHRIHLMGHGHRIHLMGYGHRIHLRAYTSWAPSHPPALPIPIRTVIGPLSLLYYTACLPCAYSHRHLTIRITLCVWGGGPWGCLDPGVECQRL